MKKLSIFCFCMFLLSCATSNHLKTGANTTNKPGDGIVLASVTRGLKDSKGVSTKAIIAKFHVSSDDKNFTLESGSIWGESYDQDKNDLVLEEGQLNVLSLPPGDYYITGWSLFDAGRAGAGPGIGITVGSKNYVKRKFVVEENKVTYLGDLHLDVISYFTLIRIRVLEDGIPNCRNELNRDHKIFSKKFPAFKNWEVMNYFQKC